VCVSDTLLAEIKRIVKESEILKYDSPTTARHDLFAYCHQGRRYQVAAEEQGRSSRAGDPDRQRPHLIRGTLDPFVAVHEHASTILGLPVAAFQHSHESI
jgi:hypothetical protein